MFDILKRKIGEREKKEREETSKCSDFIQSKQLHEYVEKDNLWNDLKYRCTTWSNLVVLFFFVSSLILLFASLFTVSVPSSMLNPIFICTRIVFVRFFVVVVPKWLMYFFFFWYSIADHDSSSYQVVKRVYCVDYLRNLLQKRNANNMFSCWVKTPKIKIIQSAVLWCRSKIVIKSQYLSV